MKKATEKLVQYFPYTFPFLKEKEFPANESTLTQHERAIVSFGRFFEYEEAFDLNSLFQEVDPEWIPVALEILQTYYYEDTYLSKTPKPLIIHDSSDLINQTEFAELLNTHGTKMDAKKIHMYRKRGKLPKETIYIGSKPYWLREDALSYISESQKAENDFP